MSVVFKILASSLVSGGIHGYVWWRLVWRSRLPRRWLIGITVAMVVLFVAVPVTTWSRNRAPELSAALSWISLPWMALVGLTCVALLAIHIGQIALWLGKRLSRRISQRPPEPTSPSRRTFLARATGGAALMVGSASVARGMISARADHEIVDVEVKLAKLPPALDGFSIVQLSDLHVGLTIDRAFVERVVEQTNRLSPDLIAMTGDLIDGQVDDLRDATAPLANLRARHGVYAVTGNHEYYSGADPWIAELTRLGFRYLRNQRVTIGEPDACFELAGVDDHSAWGFPGHGENFKQATAGRDPSRALVLLAHQPRQVRRAARYGVDLQLSGHTHGGQIWPWHYIVRMQQRGLLAGLYQIRGTQLYVTRGCGYWGPPVRLLAPLEITRVILRRA
ncbi:MAG: metallophosphoesterase [Kofleriaceae bacterium]